MFFVRQPCERRWISARLRPDRRRRNRKPDRPRASQDRSRTSSPLPDWPASQPRRHRDHAQVSSRCSSSSGIGEWKPLRAYRCSEAAGERPRPVLLAAHVGSRAQAAAADRGGRRLSLDRPPARKNDRLRGGEIDHARCRGDRERRRPPGGRGRSASPTRTTILIDRRQARGRRRPPGRAASLEGTLSQALQRRGSAGGEPWRPGIVHVTRSRHLGAARGRQERGGAPAPEVPRSPRARSSASTWRSSRAACERAAASVIDAPPGRDAPAQAGICRHRSPAQRARTARRSMRCPTRNSSWSVSDRGLASDRRPPRGEDIGHPVCGDREYGTAGALRPAPPVAPRAAARARPVRFTGGKRWRPHPFPRPAAALDARAGEGRAPGHRGFDGTLARPGGSGRVVRWRCSTRAGPRIESSSCEARSGRISCGCGRSCTLYRARPRPCEGTKPPPRTPSRMWGVEREASGRRRVPPSAIDAAIGWQLSDDELPALVVRAGRLAQRQTQPRARARGSRSSTA